MEIGLYTFADIGTHPVTKQTIGPHERMLNLMEEIELADQVGLDVFAVGEHHRPDYAVSAPVVVLGAAAVKTKQNQTFQCSYSTQFRRSCQGVSAICNGRSIISGQSRNYGRTGFVR